MKTDTGFIRYWVIKNTKVTFDCDHIYYLRVLQNA
jgi:hypothetical protein